MAGCASSYLFEPSSSNPLGFDVAFGNLFPAGALTHNGTYDMTVFFDSLTVSGSPAPTVPEPASAALAAIGLALCMIRLIGRRRKGAPGISL